MYNIEVSYISPMSTYKFKANCYYELVFVNSDDKNISIFKINLNELNNVNDKMKGYHIGKKICTNTPYGSIHLFEKYNGTIAQLFTVNFNLLNTTQTKLIAELKKPIKINHTNYTSYLSYASNKFYHNSEFTNDVCMLFLAKVKSSSLMSVNPFNYSFLLNQNDFYYIRKNKICVKEDVKVCEKESNKTTDVNMIISASSGKVKCFKLTTGIIKIGELFFDVKNLMQYGSCGYVINDVCDVVSTPSGGVLREIKRIVNAGLPPGRLYRFDNDYYVDTNISERDHLSVIYGNNIGSYRTHPEYSEKQPKMKLVFNVIVFSTDYKDNENIKIGEYYDVGTILCQSKNNGVVVVLVNKSMKTFGMHEKLQTYLCRKDIVATLL